MLNDIESSTLAWLLQAIYKTELTTRMGSQAMQINDKIHTKITQGRLKTYRRSYRRPFLSFK